MTEEDKKAVEEHIEATLIMNEEDLAKCADKTCVVATKSKTDTVMSLEAEDEDEEAERSSSKFDTILTRLEDTISALTFKAGIDSNTDFYSSVGTTTLEVIAEADAPVQHSSDAVNDFSDVDNLNPVNSDFKMKSKIAEGGQGKIWRAIDKHFHRVVAIKSLRENLLDKKEERTSFMDEAELTAQLEHPSIVPVYGLYSDDRKGLHLAMKLIAGRTLKEHLAALTKKYRNMKRFQIILAERKLLHQRLEFFLKICDAMAYAHHKHVVHRDLKPENIMIGQFNETYIMDWGIAESFDPEHLQPPKHISGTPRYVAPDILLKRPMDQRADIYSMGVILFEMVYMKRAYPQKDQDKALIAGKYGRLATFKHAFGCPVDDDLTAIVEHALAYEMENRYFDAESLAKDVRNYLNDEPVSVSHHPKLSNMRRYIRRHSQFLLWCVLALVCFLVVGGALTLTNELQRQMQERQTEEAISNMYSESIVTGKNFDVEYLKLSGNLDKLARELEIRMNIPVAPRADMVFRKAEDVPENGEPGLRMVYSTDFDRLISYDAFVYHLAPGAGDRDLMSALAKCSPMVQSFKEMFGVNDAAEDASCPFQNTYAIFENGLHLMYPYMKACPASYDARTKDWYRKAIAQKSGKVHWSEPFARHGTIGTLLLSASRPILDGKGKRIGVMEADINFNELLRSVGMFERTSPVVVSKYLLSREGKVYADTAFRLAPAIADGRVELKSFYDKALLKKMWTLRNGYTFPQVDKRFIYFFIYLKSMDWLYVEKIEYKSLLESVN